MEKEQLVTAIQETQYALTELLKRLSEDEARKEAAAEKVKRARPLEVGDHVYYSTLKSAAIVGVTIRQVLYLRQKEYIVPEINPKGTGKSLYYSENQVCEMGVFFYLQEKGLTLPTCGVVLQRLLSLESLYPANGSHYIVVIKSKNLIDIFPYATYGLQEVEADLAAGFSLIPLALKDIFSSLSW